MVLLILSLVRHNFHKVNHVAMAEKPNTPIEYQFEKNFPHYEIHDDALFEEIEKSIAVQKNYEVSDGSSDLASLWARIIVCPSSVRKDEKRFDVGIAGVYYPMNENDLGVRLDYTHVSVEKTDGKVITLTEIGATSNPEYLSKLFHILNRKAGVPIPNLSSDTVITAPNTVSIFAVNDDSLYQYLGNLSIDHVTEISDDPIAATCYINKTNVLKPSNEYFKVELLTDAKSANLYKIKIINYTTREIVSLGKIKFEYWKKLYDEHKSNQ